MNLRDKLAGESDDPVVAQALEHFKASVDAWSDAAYSRPRTTVVRPAGHSWRLAASWALGCVLAAGSLAGAVYEHYHRQELARIAAMQAAQKARQARLEAEKSAAANAVTNDQDLLATVDSDVSREVPAAMEPLAQLMDDNGTR
jgi:hypothetical protein